MFLREQIQLGTWPQTLPGELELAKQLQVGRNTIRSALALLELEGWLTTRAGKRREVTGKIAPTEAARQTAVLLLAVPFHALSSTTLLWMEALRRSLEGIGWQLLTEVESAAYRRSPSTALEALAAKHPGVVWVLHRSTLAMQRWFETRRLPTILAGSRYAGVSLPQVDTDYRAVSRHAASRFVALGHRHLLVVGSRTALAGDEESITGFQEGAGPATVSLAYHNETPDGVVAVLRQSLEARPLPTGWFILRADHFATAQTWLLQHGVRLPAQISLVSRDDEPFLQHLYPEPTRYRRSAEAFARKLHRLIISGGKNGPLTHETPRLMPDFIRGATLGKAPPA
ncbi:regulatory protein, gntR family [Prosthecobacter debontii]|uniref:Regulatory protein, gntR family n=1 Tax=Prosthecobacter debontii TaxID=48467 RepID=A0A1T4XHZ9_9BACT|nr:substrate-binding domain-containing protein [Prosthecobacter debontii]SKA89117.1 regulatory protein, gntR family [Prosthecobacter debontii]